jgi:serine/threonine protein kinase
LIEPVKERCVGLISFLFGGSKKRFADVPRINLKDRFDLESRLGQGSMSKVWRARDRQTARTVCIKVLDKEKTARFDARFIGLERPHEGQVCTSLRHRNIVATYEWGFTKQVEIFIVMELIEGLGLNFLIETKAKQLDGNRINFLVQACDAVGYIHDQGYMHRDICPRNIMVTQKGQVKLIDFGLTIPNRPEFRKPGNRTGTANYMAPELIKRQATDQRVDLFALGVTAYETITGHLPWEGAQSLQTMLSHVNSPAANPKEFAPDIDNALCALLSKAVERDPRDRFQTAREFRAALKELPKQDW